MDGNTTYTRGDANVRYAFAADAQARNVTHLYVHARGNTRAPIHGESIDIHAESELRECTSSTEFNSYPACNESSSNLADSSFLSSFVIFIFFLFSYIFVLLSLCTPYFVYFFVQFFCSKDRARVIGAAARIRAFLNVLAFLNFMSTSFDGL